MKKLEWVQNVKTGTRAWVIEKVPGWDKVVVMTLSGKAYWKLANTVTI